MGRPSQIDITKLAHLREEKWLSYGQISRMMGVSIGAISWQCLMHGIEHPSKVTRLRKPSGGLEHRNGYVIRRFTAEEDAELLRLAMAGVRTSEIARKLGRKGNSVRGRLATLARHDARNDVQ